MAPMVPFKPANDLFYTDGNVKYISFNLIARLTRKLDKQNNRNLHPLFMLRPVYSDATQLDVELS